MKIVIFGLALSSSWGNGHATLWRGLCRALVRAGHDVAFYERDVPYYAAHRDLHQLEGGELILYADWPSVRRRAEQDLEDADVAITTSYCPDAVMAADLMQPAPALKVFYDLDTPVTLASLKQGKPVPYLPPTGLSQFDLVLSYTGGEALAALRDRLGGRRVAPLYGSVDPAVHRPMPPRDHYRAALSYLGTYSEDRQAKLEQLFLRPALDRPNQRFLLAGAQYPPSFPWSDNLFFVQHLPPGEHPAFF